MFSMSCRLRLCKSTIAMSYAYAGQHRLTCGELIPWPRWLDCNSSSKSSLYATYNLIEKRALGWTPAGSETNWCDLHVQRRHDLQPQKRVWPPATKRVWRHKEGMTSSHKDGTDLSPNINVTPTTLWVVNALTTHTSWRQVVRFESLMLVFWRIDGCAIGQMLVWVVNAKVQSDDWVVNFKAWVVNYTWYNIQRDIILELRNLRHTNKVSFPATFMMSSKLIIPLLYLETNVNITVDININLIQIMVRTYAYQPWTKLYH